MSSPPRKVNKKCRICNRPFDSKRKSLQGTICKHHVCVDCIASKDAARRSLFEGGAAAVGPLLQCPVPQCEQGRFDADELRSCSDVDEVISSSDEGIDDVLSPGTHCPQVVQVKQECSLSSAILVTPIPVKVKSEHINGVVNRNKVDNTDSAVSCSKVKSEGLDHDYDTDDYSRFSQDATSSLSEQHNVVNPFTEETDEDSRFSEQDDNPDSDEDSRFSSISDHHVDELKSDN